MDDSPTGARDAVFQAPAPPLIDLLGEDTKSNLGRHVNNHRHAGLITGDRLVVVGHILRLLGARSACALKARN